MNRAIALAVFLYLQSFTAYADINDRINACEDNGGGSCIYDILRELASKNDINVGNKSCYVVQDDDYSPIESNRLCDLAGNYDQYYCVFAYEFNVLMPDFSSAYSSTTSKGIKEHKPKYSAEEAAAACKSFLLN
jgi:hypothetical protein